MKTSNEALVRAVSKTVETTLHDTSTPPERVMSVHILRPRKTEGEEMALPGVLLIDNDRAYRSHLARYVGANGFDCHEFDQFETALGHLQSSEGAFVVVPDLKVHARHLFDFIAHFKRAGTCSILVLSAHAEETEKIVALELGSDDFIGKNTDRREILARIRAAARRLLAGAVAGPPGPEPAAIGTVVRRPWQFLSDKRELHDPYGRMVRLTSAEFSLLDILVANTGQPLSRDHLSIAALGRSYRASDRSIDNLVAKLRRKLHDPAKQARMIKTARPMGYVFTGFTAPDPDDLGQSHDQLTRPPAHADQE